MARDGLNQEYDKDVDPRENTLNEGMIDQVSKRLDPMATLRPMPDAHPVRQSRSDTPTPATEAIKAPLSNSLASTTDSILTNYVSTTSRILQTNQNIVTPLAREVASPAQLVDMRSIAPSALNFSFVLNKNFQTIKTKVDSMGIELSKKVTEVRRLEASFQTKQQALANAQITLARGISTHLTNQIKSFQEQITSLQSDLAEYKKKNSDLEAYSQVQSNENEYEDEGDNYRYSSRSSNRHSHRFGLGALAIASRFAHPITHAVTTAGEIAGIASTAAIGYFLIKSGIGEKIITQIMPTVTKVAEGAVKDAASKVGQVISDELAGKNKEFDAKVTRAQEQMNALGAQVRKKVEKEITNWWNESWEQKKADATSALSWLYKQGPGSDINKAASKQVTEMLDNFRSSDFWRNRGTMVNGRTPTQQVQDYNRDRSTTGLEDNIYRGSGLLRPKEQVDAYNRERQGLYPLHSQVYGPPNPKSFSDRGLKQFYSTMKAHRLQDRFTPGANITLNHEIQHSWMGEEAEGQASFGNWITGPTPWGNIVPNFNAGGNARSPGGGLANYFGGNSGNSGPMRISKPQVPNLPPIVPGLGGSRTYSGPGPLAPGQVDKVALFKAYTSEFSKSPLNGYVPKDGAHFGITTGKPEEWARFALAESMQESGLNSFAQGGGLNQFEAADLHRYHVDAAVTDPNAQVKALVHQFNSIKDVGYIRGPNNTGAAAYFGPVRRSSFDSSFNSSSELSKHYAEANKVYNEVGQLTGVKGVIGGKENAKVLGITSRNKTFLTQIEQYREQNKQYQSQQSQNLSYMVDDNRAQKMQFGATRHRLDQMTGDLSPKIVDELHKIARATGGNEQAIAQYMASMHHPRSGAWCAEFAASVMTGALGKEEADKHIPYQTGNVNLASNYRLMKNAEHLDRPEPGAVAVAKRGRTGGQGSHVTFVESIGPHGEVYLEGGNQGGRLIHEANEPYDYYKLKSSLSPEAQRAIDGASYRAYHKTHKEQSDDIGLKSNTAKVEDPAGIASSVDPKTKSRPLPKELERVGQVNHARDQALNRGRDYVKAARGGAYSEGGIRDVKEEHALQFMPGLKRFGMLSKPSVIDQVESQRSDIAQTQAKINAHTQVNLNGAIQSKPPVAEVVTTPKTVVHDPKPAHAKSVNKDPNAQTNYNGAIRDRVKSKPENKADTLAKSQDVQMPRSNLADSSPSAPGENGTGDYDQICFV